MLTKRIVSKLHPFPFFLHFAWVVDDAKCIVVTRVCVSVSVCVCLCVCLSAAIRPHYCTDPDVTWGHGRGCPLVVHCWADFQSGHGLHCCGNIMRTLVTIKLASIPRYDDIVWTARASWAGSARAAGRWLAGDRGRSQNCAPYMGSGRGWLAGDWPSMGAFSTLLRRPGLRASTGGVLATKSEQNVSEYMLVLALCLVFLFTDWMTSEGMLLSTHCRDLLHQLPELQQNIHL